MFNKQNVTIILIFVARVYKTEGECFSEFWRSVSFIIEESEVEKFESLLTINCF